MLTSFSLDLLSSAVDLSAVCQPKETIIGSRFRSNSYNSTLGLRVRTKKKENEKLKEFEGRLPESQGQNLALTSLCVCPRPSTCPPSARARQRSLEAASERGGNSLKGLKDFHQKAKAFTRKPNLALTAYGASSRSQPYFYQKARIWP